MSTAALTPTPKMQFSDANGVPLAGGKVYTYNAGTSVALATYTDSTESAQNTNPIILDAGGFANIWLGAAFYKFVVQDALGIQQYTTDNVSSSNLPFNTSAAYIEGATSAGPIGSDVLQGSSALHRLMVSNNGAAPDAVVLQNTPDTLSNKTLINPILTNPSINSLASLNPSYLFAELQPGSDASAKIQAAIDALPSNGGVVDARNLLDPSGTGSTDIDPGTKTVTLLLGATVYRFNKITLRRSFALIGMGPGDSVNPGTGIISTSVTNAPLVVLPAGPIPEVIVSGISFLGASGNTTQNCFEMIAPTGGGLWYSTFFNIVIQDFAGHHFLFDGQATSSINQFLSFRDIYSVRPVGGASNLKIIGMNGQFTFSRVQFDGNSRAGINIEIAEGAPAPVLPPYNIEFDNVTFQTADTGISIAGANSILIRGGHAENMNKMVLVTTGATFGSWGIELAGIWIAGTVGINAGAGYLLNMTGIGVGQGNVIFRGNYLFGPPPDAYFVPAGPQNLAASDNAGPSTGPFSDVINSGINQNGSGLKHARVSTGAILAGARNSVTITWASAFVDANYTPICMVLDAATAVTAQGLVMERINLINASSVRVTIFNPTGGTLTQTVLAFAVHD